MIFLKLKKKKHHRTRDARVMRVVFMMHLGFRVHPNVRVSDPDVRVSTPATDQINNK